MNKSTAEQIRDLDCQLLVATDRLAKYVRAEQADSITVQQHVVDRQLDQRLNLMRERDGVPA